MKYPIIISSLLIFLFIYALGSLPIWENVAISITIYFLFNFLDNLGQKIVIMDLAVLMAAFTCLIVPVIFYHVYTKENPLARMWIKFMFIPSDEYFSFAVPAVFA